mgnify:CR=1 FL=1
MAIRPTTIDVKAELSINSFIVELHKRHGHKVVNIRGIDYLWSNATQRNIVIHLVYEMISNSFDLQNLKTCIRYMIENEMHKMQRNETKVIGHPKLP